MLPQRLTSCRRSIGSTLGFPPRLSSSAEHNLISSRAVRLNCSPWKTPFRRYATKPPTKAADASPATKSWHERLGPVSSFLSWFHATQAEKPRTVQLIVTLITYGTGDLLAQVNGSEPYDPWRTVRMLVIGGIAALPGYRWFIWLGNSFNYASKTLSLVAKVAVQQMVFAPVFNTYFFGMQAALTGISWQEVVERIKATVPRSVINSIKFWPPVTAFTFMFVAPPYRFMFSGLFAILWQGYLSFLNRREERQQIRARAAITETAS